MSVIVAPFAGAWIEMISTMRAPGSWDASLPSRERGLKCFCPGWSHYFLVAPFTGAWIEIAWVIYRPRVIGVAPFAGAWIEIMTRRGAWTKYQSLPSRERGLK